VLNTERAVAMSIFVFRTFVKKRKLLATNRELARRLRNLEKKLTARLDVHEGAIFHLFAEIRSLLTPPPPLPEPKKRRIGFRGDEGD